MGKNDKFFKLKEEISELIEQADKHLKDYQKACKHTTVFEYWDANKDPCSAPERICTECGLQEAGWGCGYKRLGDGKERIVDQVNFDKFLKIISKYGLNFIPK